MNKCQTHRNVAGREGDQCLAEPAFVESHPIVYWNLVWFLDRANIDNHLPELLCNKADGDSDKQGLWNSDFPMNKY